MISHCHVCAANIRALPGVSAGYWNHNVVFIFNLLTSAGRWSLLPPVSSQYFTLLLARFSVSGNAWDRNLTVYLQNIKFSNVVCLLFGAGLNSCLLRLKTRLMKAVKVNQNSEVLGRKTKTMSWKMPKKQKLLRAEGNCGTSNTFHTQVAMWSIADPVKYWLQPL